MKLTFEYKKEDNTSTAHCEVTQLQEDIFTLQFNKPIIIKVSETKYYYRINRGRKEVL